MAAYNHVASVPSFSNHDVVNHLVEFVSHSGVHTQNASYYILRCHLQEAHLMIKLLSSFPKETSVTFFEASTKLWPYLLCGSFGFANSECYTYFCCCKCMPCIYCGTQKL